MFIAGVPGYQRAPLTLSQDCEGDGFAAFASSVERALIFEAELIAHLAHLLLDVLWDVGHLKITHTITAKANAPPTFENASGQLIQPLL